jgi:hypothetical protein
MNTNIAVKPRYDYELPAVGQHLGTIVRVNDLGIVQSAGYGASHKILIYIALDDEATSTGGPKVVVHRCPFNSAPTSRLGKYLWQLGLQPSSATSFMDICKAIIEEGHC